MAPVFWDLMTRRSTSSRSSISSRGTSCTNEDDKFSVTKSHHQHPHRLEVSSAMFNSPPNGVPSFSDVVVVGAGPAGLMLATNLVRFGLKVDLVDDRADKTSTGRADALQPKTLETLRQMRLAEPLLRKGVKVYDMAFWKSSASKPLHRIARETHYPISVDVLDPYLLLCHQGFVEHLFLNDLEERGVETRRSTSFVDFKYTGSGSSWLEVTCKSNQDQSKKIMKTKYLVGCDGAHSQVRKTIPGARPVGAAYDAVWGVLDGELDTDFPDIWSKVTIFSRDAGSILICPRERNMTRLYVELKPETRKSTSKDELSQEFVMSRAQEIMEPYTLCWKTVEWFGRYQIGQRVATRFTDDENRVFIAGDASHTHSPKASQGMNTSMHDSWNLAWKLNLMVRGLAKPALLATYESERRKIAEDLIRFDYEHTKAFAAGNNIETLAHHFISNISFISGVGAWYQPNVLNVPHKSNIRGNLKPGFLPPPAKATRYVDANPIDLQNDIPTLGQFRIFFFTHNVQAAKPFLDVISVSHYFTHNSFAGRLTAACDASYTLQPPLAAPHDEFIRPGRYTPVSCMFTYALVTDMPKEEVEISNLPPLFRESRWTFYLDDIPEQDTRRQTCMQKWLGGLDQDEIVVVNIRPDGYVGTLRRWPRPSRDCGQEAAKWLDDYYESFLKV